MKLMACVVYDVVSNLSPLEQGSKYCNRQKMDRLEEF